MIGRAMLQSPGGGERTIVMLSPLAVLEGSPAYYSRFGFVEAAAQGLRLPLPDWAPPAAAQVMLLASYDPTDESLRGTVAYPPAFDGLD
jgi:putative acetyltransferase